MILPISDKVEGAVSFKIFERVERYLKNSDWCYYKSNSGILNILQNYQPNLERHLTNPEVLRTIANKTQAGSLIHVKLDIVSAGVDLSTTIFGDNGSDIYFKEKVRLSKVELSLISQTIINWLNEYEKTIPYDGRVIGVLGNTFTVDIGQASKVFIGNNVTVRKPVKKKKHPLLEEVVEWEFEDLGKGQIVNVSEFQASGNMKEYITRQRLSPGDWVIMERKLAQDVKNKVDYPELQGYEFGQLGVVQLGGKLGRGSDTTNISSTSRKISGFEYGVHANVEVWATRHFWAGGGFQKVLGSYSADANTSTTLDSVGYDYTETKLKVGYKYLPLGFFYGPQIDLYLGYGTYKYELDKSATDGFGDHKISGILMGFKGSMPIHKTFRGFMKLDFLVSPDYEEESSVFGTSLNSATSYQIEFGINYHYSPQMTLDGSAEVTSNKAKFSGGNEFHFNDFALKGGVSFNF